LKRYLVTIAMLASCHSAQGVAPRWLIARHDVVALDDATVHLRRGFGVEIVDVRDDRGRSSEGRWFPLAELEAAPAFTGSASASLPTHIARPAEVGARERWLDVDLAAQRLTALEGDTIVRAMKVSTGVGEEGAAYSTPKGTFHVYAKLRRATMASPSPELGAPADPHPYRFEGVPDVQYFYKEIALHGAYWHRRFGERVSHGCVNLAPADAAWLFAYTTPALDDAERERAAAPGKPGTLVRVR
jgi:lipoprotein-anchoring transpeptidase ErfK/SrfK